MEEADYFYLQLFSEVRTHKLPIQGGHSLLLEDWDILEVTLPNNMF